MTTKTTVLGAILAAATGGMAVAQPLTVAPVAPGAGPGATMAQAPGLMDDGGMDWMRGPGGEEERFGRGRGPGRGPADWEPDAEAPVPNTAPLLHAIYDTDGDGRITAEEIAARKAERFATADADGDGGLSPQELVALDEAIRREVLAARAAVRIARLDDNGDGLLQAEEIEARTPRIAPIVDRLDADDDGGLTVEELEADRRDR